MVGQDTGSERRGKRCSRTLKNAIWKVEAFRNIYICMDKRILNRITL